MGNFCTKENMMDEIKKQGGQQTFDSFMEAIANFQALANRGDERLKKESKQLEQEK